MYLQRTCSRCCPVFKRPFLLNMGMLVLPTSSIGRPSDSSYTDRDRWVSAGKSRYCGKRQYKQQQQANSAHAVCCAVLWAAMASNFCWGSSKMQVQRGCGSGE